MMKKIQSISIAIVSVAALFVTQSSQAQILPWYTFGPGSINPATGVFEGVGHGFPVGNSTFGGTAVLIPTGDPNFFEWTADDTYTTAAGHEFTLLGSGTFRLIPIEGTMFRAIWFGQWEVAGGTGPFANVGPGNRPIRMIAVNPPFDIVNDPVWEFSFVKFGNFDLGWW